MSWKPSEKGTMQIYTGLPQPLALCILKAQEVATKGVYWLPHTIYYCRSWKALRKLLAGDDELMQKLVLLTKSPSICGTAHAQFVEGLQFSFSWCWCFSITQAVGPPPPNNLFTRCPYCMYLLVVPVGATVAVCPRIRWWVGLPGFLTYS